MKKRYMEYYVKSCAAADLAAQKQENGNPGSSAQFTTIFQADAENASQKATMPVSIDISTTSGPTLPVSKSITKSILNNKTSQPKISASESNINTSSTPKNTTLPLKVPPLSADAIHIMTGWDSFMKITLAQSKTQPEHIQNFVKKYELSATEGVNKLRECREINVSSISAEKETPKQKRRINISFNEQLNSTLQEKQKTENTISYTSHQATEDCSKQNKNKVNSAIVLNSEIKSLGAEKCTETFVTHPAHMAYQDNQYSANSLHPSLQNLENLKHTNHTRSFAPILHGADTIIPQNQNTVNLASTTYYPAQSVQYNKNCENVTTFDLLPEEQNSQEGDTIVSSQYFEENLNGQNPSIENIYNSLCSVEARHQEQNIINCTNLYPAEERLHALVNEAFDDSAYFAQNKQNQYKSFIHDGNYLPIINTKQDLNKQNTPQFNSNETFKNASCLPQYTELTIRKTGDKIPNNAQEYENISRGHKSSAINSLGPRNQQKLIGVVNPDMNRFKPNSSFKNREQGPVQKIYNQIIYANKTADNTLLVPGTNNTVNNRESNVNKVSPKEGEENTCAQKIMARRKSAKLTIIEIEDSATTNNTKQVNVDSTKESTSAKATRSAQMQAKAEELIGRFQDTLEEIKDTFTNTSAVINNLYVSNLRTSHLFAKILKHTQVAAGKSTLKRKLTQCNEKCDVDPTKKHMLKKETVEKQTPLDRQTKEEKRKYGEYEDIQPQQTKLKSEPKNKNHSNEMKNVNRKRRQKRRHSENNDFEELTDDEFIVRQIKAEQKQLYKRLADLKNKNKKNKNSSSVTHKMDTKWTLKYNEKAPGVVELVKNSGVFVKDIKLQDCLRRAQGNCRALARLLIKEVFTEKALICCTQPGNKNIKGKLVLDDWALNVLLRYIVKGIGKRKDWQSAPKTDIVKSIRYVMYHMKAKAYLRYT